MPHTRLQVRAVAMCADDALSNYRLGMPAALGVCSVGDGMVDMIQVVRVDWHPVLMKVY
jgi:hypothetical protein